MLSMTYTLTVFIILLNLTTSADSKHAYFEDTLLQELSSNTCRKSADRHSHAEISPPFASLFGCLAQLKSLLTKSAYITWTLPIVPSLRSSRLQWSSDTVNLLGKIFLANWSTVSIVAKRFNNLAAIAMSVCWLKKRLMGTVAAKHSIP